MRGGGMGSPSGRPPKPGVVSVRACVRRAVSGSEGDSKCKSHACTLTILLFVLGIFCLCLLGELFPSPVRSNGFK